MRRIRWREVDNQVHICNRSLPAHYTEWVHGSVQYTVLLLKSDILIDSTYSTPCATSSHL